MSDSSPKLRVSIVGTAGLPARYGGFETLADNLTKSLADRVEFTVFCPRTPRPERHQTYNGARLRYLPLRANGAQSIIYDACSIIMSTARADRILILGAGASFMLPLLFWARKKFVLNFGGLEWMRDKWNIAGRRYLRWAEFIGVRFSDEIVADNQVFVDHVASAYKRNANLIEYGGDHCQTVHELPGGADKYSFIGQEYYLSISRAQEDNNIHLLLEAFAEDSEKMIVVISNWTVSDYGRKLKSRFAGIGNIVLLDAIYAIDELNFIRTHCHAYVHSHSFCGTAPSLVEMMNLGKPILCYAAPTNIATTENRSRYFRNADELREMIRRLTQEDLHSIAADMEEIALRRYRWEVICDKYYRLLAGESG